MEITAITSRFHKLKACQQSVWTGGPLISAQTFIPFSRQICLSKRDIWVFLICLHQQKHREIKIFLAGTFGQQIVSGFISSK